MRFLGANTSCQYLDIKFNPVVSMEQKLLQNIMILVISTFLGVSLALLSLWGPLNGVPKGLQRLFLFLHTKWKYFEQIYSSNNNKAYTTVIKIVIFVIFSCFCYFGPLWEPLQGPPGSLQGLSSQLSQFWHYTIKYHSNLIISNISFTGEEFF